MSFDDSVLNDLGIKDNSGEKDDGFEKFLSKPIQRQYQPFGGPKPQQQSSIAQPQYAPQEPQPQPQPQPQPYHNFNDYDLDAYEQIKKKHGQISQYTRENKKSASHYGGLYDDFKKNEFTPYFESMGGFGDFETDEEYISAIDEMYKSDLKNSQQEDGFFGAPDSKLASQENLKKYASWNQPNGMRDRFLRLKAERDRRKATAEQAESMEYALFEHMTSIPIAQREALDASLKSRTAKPRSKKATNEMLNQMQFEQPVVDMVTGEVTNLEKTDPRISPPSAVDMVTGQRTPAAGKQAKRLEAAMRGDMAGFTSRRESVAKDRQLRDKGFMFSNGGQIDGRPIGMSRKDTDLLDLEEMKKAGMTDYKGQPIEQAIESLGGMERVKVAKVMQSVYAAKSNYEDVQLEYLKNSGGAKGDALREKMEAAREEVNKTIGLASQFGLDNELFEQAETTGWLSAIGNAVKRGLLMSEMSDYTPDFLTNTLDADEMQRFIEIASEIEELPTSSTMKRVKSTKSDGFLDAMGNLLFDNPAAIPEMFVESMASFLPSAIKWMLPTAAAGAVAGSIIPGAGTAAGATLGARASWGAASFVLEASGMALEGMQELGIDWKNPKIFAAAWTNESIRNKIQKKMVQKGTPIAVADMLTGMMAGKVMAIANHTGNAMFKGGKLLNKTQFNKTAGAVPRFTKFQKTRNAAAELGADSLMGMSGEYLGQWASKEPGEDWDWDAIAAEGIVGVGPGVLSSALEMRSRSGNYFGNAPIEITGENMTETGSMGTVTRAGYSAPYQTFNDAESMMGHLQSVEGVSPESLQFTQNWVERMYAANPEEMSKLKIAFSPRTPDANLKNRGTFEARDGHNIMYINEKEFAADPMGAFMHESGHFARIMVMSDEELRSAWGGLGEDSQLEAYTQYFTKKPDATFDSLDEKTQKKVRRAFDRTPDDVLAEEWFSYQWGRVLMGYTVDKNVAKPLKNFKDKVIHPILGEYAGTENLAGGKSEQGYILDQKILQFLGYENGMPTPKVPDEGGKPTNSTPQTREQTQTKLNAMPGTPQEKSKIAKAVNAMLGADILTESPSFYSNMNRAAAVAASKDIEEFDKKKDDAETVADTLKESNLRRLEKKIAKRKKTDGYDAKDQPQDILSPEELNEQQLRDEGGFQPKAKPEEISESPGGKQLPEGLGTIPRKPQKSDGLFKSKPNIKAVQKRIKRAEKKEAQKAEIRKKRDAIRKAKQKETVAFRVDEIAPKDYEKPRASRKFDTPAPKLGTEQDKLNQRTPSKNNTTASVNPKATSRSEQEIIKLDKILPKTKEELDQIRDLKNQLSENQAKFDSVVSLDKAIEEAITELEEEGSPSITQIISKVLNLEVLLKASPISLVSEIEKAMNPTASRSKVPSSKDIEDMATEARERIEDVKELLNLRLAEIDREIASLEPSAGAQAEITELQSKRKLVKMYLHFIAPEEASVDWKDVPHNLITFRRYKLVKGKEVYSPDTLKPIPITFGMLASMKKWQEGSGEYSNIEYRPKNVDQDKRTPQEYLWDYVNHEFKPPPVSDKDKAEIGKPFYGGLTENQYRMKLEAIKASAMFTKQQDVGKEPMGSARWEVENNIKQEARRGYPSGFTTERGANFGAVIAERIRQKSLSGKVKSDGTKAYANFDLETLEPTIPDVVALMMANGRTLELLGDPSDSMKDFDHMLFVIAREEMKSKLLGEKDKGGVPSDLENQFEYAEEDGDPFIKVQPGATLAKTLLGVLSTKARLKFERDYLEYIVENTQLSDSTSTKLNLEMSKEGMRLDSLSGDNPKVALEKLGEYLDSIKEKGGVEVRGKLVPIPKKIQESLTESYTLLRARVDNKKYLNDQLNGHTIEVIGGVSKPQSKTVSKFRVKPEDAYDFRRPLSRTSENIPAKGDHGAFTAGDMYKTFDVMTAFSKRRESPEVVADMLMGTSTGFEKERTNVGNSETAPARPINMDRAEADLLSSTDISAVDLANWYLGSRDTEVKRMEDLQMTPSSKDNKQLPGGLGEGLLPYVFRDFITAMYENLNIKDLDLKLFEESVKPFDWTYTEGRMMMGGELVDFNMFTDKEGMMHPEVMEVLTRPVVQAVLDAEGIDVYDQFDPNSENLLQRDTQKAESFDKDDSAEMQTEADDTDSGAQTSKVEVNPVEQESLKQFQNDKRQELGVDPDPVNKNPVEKRITLSDLVKSNLKDKTPEEIKAFTDDSMTDSFKQAQLAENVKEFEGTFTTKSSKSSKSSKNRTLNSDAGRADLYDFVDKPTVGSVLRKLANEVSTPERKKYIQAAVSAFNSLKDFSTEKKFEDINRDGQIIGRSFKESSSVRVSDTPVRYLEDNENRSAAAKYTEADGAFAMLPDIAIDRDRFLNKNPETVSYNIIHEAFHGATINRLTNLGLFRDAAAQNRERKKDTPAARLLRAYDIARAKAGFDGSQNISTAAEKGLYGLTSFEEFLSEALSKNSLIKFLDSIEAPTNSKMSLFDELINAIKDLLGLKIKGTLLGDVIKNLSEFTEQQTAELESKKGEEYRPILNSDATLTSDVNPNLAKANLLSRIAGDSELKKNFEEWLKDKKDSELAGSFMMSFVDQADPLKRVHRSLFDTLKESGLDIAKGPMRSLYNMLNVHGKWHQYFGKGYDTVEQARIQFIQPIKDAMLKYGIDQGTFGNYLLARAAPSRNQHLRDKVKRLQKEAEELTGTERQTALKDIEKIYLNKDGSVKHSGISDQAAYDQITELEKDQNFVNFANEALDPYYNMNKESIDMLRTASMIRESTQLDGVQEGISEYDRMVGAMSKIDLADSNSDFNFAGSKIKLSDPKYSYSPMQGFEGETEAFFDAERAWEELGKGQNSSGKGWDQPKSTFLNDGAFGRYDGTKGPNPDSVLANAINQFFDSAIRSHKNEVSQSFGEMFQLMKSIAYPDSEDTYEPSDPELRIARGMLSKLPEEQKKKIKEEFDEIFEQDFQKTAEKNMYTLETTKDGLDNEIVAKRKKLNAEFKQDPLVFVYRKDGAPQFIKFKNTTKGTRMARSMKNLKYESLPSVLKYFNKVTRFMAQMFTSMNPAFIIPNFFRDLGTAFIHLTEDDKKKLVKDVFKFKNLKWIKSIAQAELLISQGKDPMKGRTRTEKLKGQTEAKYAQAILKRGDKIEMYAYAKRNGAKIGYVRHDTVPELIRNIKKETGKSEGATKRRLKNVLSYVDAANTGVENSVRMSTFWAAIKNGYTPQESATMSRNITVDFNQKGELTQAFGSLYVFFGAAVNSTHRFMTTLNRRSPAERATLIGGIATASFLVATFNRLLDDDEDEAVPDYDTISSYKRDTNLIMPIPAGLPDFFNDKKDTGYFSMPLPLGYNLFWSMGQVVADTFANNYGDIRGGSGVMEGANRLLESSMNAFNPVGGASIATIGTPTFVTPIIELWANKNFMGREIRYKDDQFGVPEPGHMQDPKSTPAHWNALSKGLNEFFGGNDVIKGSLSGGFGSKNPLMYDQDSDIKFDISGNQFKHMFYGYLGGPGQLLDTAFGGLFSATQGKASIDNVGQVPIVNRFIRGTTYGSHTRELYYNLRDTVKTAEKAVKDAKKISPKAYSLVNNDLRPLLSINSQLKAFEAQKNKFSRLKSKVESASNLTEAQKMQRIADIEEKELNMMVTVIKKAQSLGIS